MNSIHVACCSEQPERGWLVATFCLIPKIGQLNMRLVYPKRWHVLLVGNKLFLVIA
jgi:hypothetical protein